MSVKDFIKCLTILIWLMPPFDVNASVKDILNYQYTLPIVSDVHSHRMQTHVHQISFKDHFNDGKSVVVIDAGHGGHDPGAMGKKSKEKEIALAIALKIGNQLKATSPDIEVIYTRKEDVFIPLHKRISIANKEKADLFISIHCNYVDNPKVCGTETFVMGLHRAEENLNVAKRENSSVLLETGYESHYEGYDPNSPIGHILLSMFQNIHLDNSIKLASNVENYFAKRKRTDSRGVKQAGFVVLRQATMPSVLIETGFLSNPKEEAYLMSVKGQKEMATSVSKGISAYFGAQQPLHVKEEVVTIDKGFVVQIGVFSKPIKNDLVTKISSHGNLIQLEENGLYKYSVGHFQNKESAGTACKALKAEGFSDAFVKLIN